MFLFQVDAFHLRLSTALSQPPSVPLIPWCLLPDPRSLSSVGEFRPFRPLSDPAVVKWSPW